MNQLHHQELLDQCADFDRCVGDWKQNFGVCVYIVHILWAMKVSRGGFAEIQNLEATRTR